MEKITAIIEEQIKKAMIANDIDSQYAKVSLSNRPDLCEYQCNGCLAAAKQIKTNPMILASKVAESLKDNNIFSEVEAVAPGFINIKLSPEALSFYVTEMSKSDKFGVNAIENDTIVVDYGGANVAKPLHIGHLRSAIIGESIKRMGAYMGNNMIGDIHMGDWGLQMGLITAEMPDGDITIDELEKIYPHASARAKEDTAFASLAHENTAKPQNGDPDLTKKWKRIMDISLADLHKNYDSLDVHFELWKGESDVQPRIPALVKMLQDKGYARESDGALIVDVALPTDKKEIPPCIVRKSDGSSLYATTDLATLEEREEIIKPDRDIYITDARQAMHFVQVFRVAKQAGIVPEDRDMIHIGFGTMNGKDGKPFKTRSGGVMRLEDLIKDTNEAVLKRILDNREISKEEAREIAKIVGLAAIKYGDLSNQASKDYVFDIDRFTSFEGNTGPYILYTIVRIKSILAKYAAEGGMDISADDFKPAESVSEKKLILELVKYNDVIENAWKELAPHRICQYIYSVAEAFNSFYHEVKILSEENHEKKKSYLALISLTKGILSDCINMLGISAPDRM